MSPVCRVSLSAPLTAHVFGFWFVARQVWFTGPCMVFLQRQGKEARAAAMCLQWAYLV